jgi:predicted transcriptional regulator
MNYLSEEKFHELDSELTLYRNEEGKLTNQTINKYLSDKHIIKLYEDGTFSILTDKYFGTNYFKILRDISSYEMMRTFKKLEKILLNENKTSTRV